MPLMACLLKKYYEGGIMKKIILVILALVFLVSFSAMPVAAKGKAAASWYVPTDFDTIQQAVDSAQPGDIIRVEAGNHAGAVINKQVVIKGIEGAVISTGVPYKSGSPLTTAFRLDAGADGTEISHLVIPNDVGTLYFFAIFSRDVDEVLLHQLNITNSVQAISNYNGSDWNISHNTITGTNAVNGGGIGIMINAWDGTADYVPDGTQANNNLITHNYTEGKIGDVGFSGPGILLSSGHGASQYPGGTLTDNIVYQNTCIYTGDNGVGFEADDVPWELSLGASITGNSVIYNDFRGSTSAIEWFGDITLNTVSRNFLDAASDRGEGADAVKPPDIFN